MKKTYIQASQQAKKAASKKLRKRYGVGFTVLDTVSARWGYMLVSPWLIKSIDPVWLRRLKMFQALNSYDPTRWPMSLLIENWSAFWEIRF